MKEKKLKSRLKFIESFEYSHIQSLAHSSFWLEFWAKWSRYDSVLTQHSTIFEFCTHQLVRLAEHIDFLICPDYHIDTTYIIRTHSHFANFTCTTYTHTHAMNKNLGRTQNIPHSTLRKSNRWTNCKLLFYILTICVRLSAFGSSDRINGKLLRCCFATNFVYPNQNNPTK